MTKTRETSEPKTVAGLIDELLKLQVTRPHGSMEFRPNSELDAHMLKESEIEKAVAEALLLYGGPCVWRGELWWSQNRPRLGVLNRLKVFKAEELPWPPKQELPTPAEGKTIGFISQQHW